MLTTYDVRWACDVMRPAYDAQRRRRRPGLDRGRPAAGARHRQDRRRGQGAVVAGRPAQPVHQDPGDRGGPAGDHRDPGRGHQRQRHADLRRWTATTQVMDAFLAGLEQAKANGHDLSKIGSVASFFVSRVDTEVDKRLDKIGSDEAKALRGKAAIANAQLAYEHYERGRSPPTAGRRWPTPARTRSGRCGRRPRRRTRTTATSCTSRSWSRPARSTPCRRRPSTRSPTTARSAATPSPAPTTQARKVLDATWPRSASTTTT